MNAMLLLCDAAQICDNKLYILGGGWTLYGANSAAFAVAIKLSIDQHECDKDLLWELLLEDADGHRVMSGPGPPATQSPDRRCARHRRQRAPSVLRRAILSHCRSQ